MKQATVFHEIRELLAEADTNTEPPSRWRQFWNFMSQIAANAFIAILLVALGIGLWMLMESIRYDSVRDNLTLFYTPVAVNLSIVVFHLIFQGISV